MLHFKYFFTEIKTQTSSLILFGARQEKKILKYDSQYATKTFCLSLFRKRDKFFTVVSKMNKVSIFDVCFTLNAFSKLLKQLDIEV